MKTLLQISVIGLGFGMNFADVLHAGETGFLTAAVSIAVTIAAGVTLGWVMNNSFTISYLISVGTAICGGSAIAAIAPIIGAAAEEIAAAMGTVFLLNAVALVVFPEIGRLAALDQSAFGMWAAIAIHDTSSVVGAAAKYGDQALAIAVPVKLARALWIIPIALITPRFVQNSRRTKTTFPYFIIGFLAAASLRSALPGGDWASVLYDVAKRGLSLTLFLIGAQLSKRTLKSVGTRPIAQGILLWIFVSVTSFLCLRFVPTI